MNTRFLGTGAAEGIPSFGCTCPRCQVAREEGGSNVRKRVSLLVEAGGCRVLLDTPPEISQLLDQAGVFDLTAVVLSHEHFDHIGGLTEFEYWNQVLPQLRLTPRLEERALLSGYCSHTWLHFGDLRIMPFKIIHHVPCYGFAFGAGGSQVVHFTDSGPELSHLHRRSAKEADMVIFHTPTLKAHRHHTSVQNVIALMQDWSLQRAVITHVNHDNLTHAELVEKVAPYDITVAYDGQTMEI